MMCCNYNSFLSLSRLLFALIVISFLVNPCICFAKVTLRIKSQKEFDNLSEILTRCVAKGEKDIVVDFVRGHYYYKLHHVFIENYDFPDVSITLIGNGSTIISSGQDLIKGGLPVKFAKGFGYIDANGNDCNNFSDFYQADSIVEIIDVKTRLCRIHCSDLTNTDNIDCTNVFIRITSWYTSYLYRVNRIVDGFVYFTADNLASGYVQYGNYNVNYDYTVGNIFPRFRLVNVPIGKNSIISTPKGLVNLKSDQIIHQCEAGCFISFLNCEIKKLVIEGFKVVGCSANYQFFRFKNLKAISIVICNNEFSASRGEAIYANQTDNITIKNCVFHEIYKDVIYLTNSCANAAIISNKFYNNGKSVTNSFCIHCRGSNYHIKKNEICDFSYGAIAVGVYYKDIDSVFPSYGIVERNHIYYTSTFLQNKASWTLIDSGAIYLWTKNDGAVIRDNFIHDYEGMGSNRGIYCDDGTNNCSIYGNIILNIGNCYSIDLRLSLTLDNHKTGLKSNVNNRIYGNYFNNRFRFQGRKDDKSSIKGGNTILVEDENNLPQIVKDNLVEESSDIFVKYDKQKWYKKGLRLVR